MTTAGEVAPPKESKIFTCKTVFPGLAIPQKSQLIIDGSQLLITENYLSVLMKIV
jgi:hypothetical protein